jgi:ABC-type lipoprotein export system ATPase subunit
VKDLLRVGRKNKAVVDAPLPGQDGSRPEQGQEAIVQLRNLTKVYTTGAGNFTALKNITLDVNKGEFLGIIGKSGAGKTTLLNMISGVSEVTSGEVLFYPQGKNGRNGNHRAIPIHSLDEDELALWRGGNLGIVYQSFELMPMLDLVNNIMLPQDFLGLYQPIVSQKRALELLEIVELREHAYKLPAHTSGGQKQRVAIARALVNDPPVIVADEPTGNLDTVTAENIFQIFEKLVDQGKTVIMVTHDEDLAPRFSRRLHISDGEIVDQPGNGQPRSRNITRTFSQPLDGPIPSGEIQKPAITNGETNGLEKPAAAIAERRERNQATFEYDPEKPAILLRDVVKTYVNAAGAFTALKGINLRMNYGQFISIVGKSGSGKSTLLNMLTGIDHPTSGEVIVGGEHIYEMTESQQALWRGRNVGIVFQFFQLLPTLTLLENTMLPMDYCDVYPADERPDRAMELLKMVNLEKLAHELPASVSSGQQQSAAIARSLATDPPIIVADEPTGNLDSRSADVIIGVFQELAARGKTILIVTHDPSLTKRTDQTVIISDGEIVDQAVASALPLLDHPQMLQATRQAARRTYPPGSTIIRQGDHVEHFFIITNGEVDIVLGNPQCPEMHLARLGQGQFFGDVELMQGGQSIASARAASDKSVEVALLPREIFRQLLHGSPLTEEALTRVAQERLTENQSRSGDCAE